MTTILAQLWDALITAFENVQWRYRDRVQGEDDPYGFIEQLKVDSD